MRARITGAISASLPSRVDLLSFVVPVPEVIVHIQNGASAIDNILERYGKWQNPHDHDQYRKRKGISDRIPRRVHLKLLDDERIDDALSARFGVNEH